jgi:hypothetical protein
VSQLGSQSLGEASRSSLNFSSAFIICLCRERRIILFIANNRLQTISILATWCIGSPSAGILECEACRGRLLCSKDLVQN